MTGVGKVDKKVLRAASGAGATGWWGSHPDLQLVAGSTGRIPAAHIHPGSP